jgi:hypothetical protein
MIRLYVWVASRPRVAAILTFLLAVLHVLAHMVQVPHGH